MPGTAVLVTAAWFRIDQSNIIVSNLVTQISTQGGKYRSTVVEVEATAPLPYGFNAKLAFSRQKVRNIKDTNSANIGTGILGVGRSVRRQTWSGHPAAVHCRASRSAVACGM